MGAIKDLVDLVTQLANSVEDRRVAAELGKIQSQILAIQTEQSSLHDTNIALREEKLALKEQIQKLETAIKDSSTPIPAPADAVRCINCSTISRPFYMNRIGAAFRDMLGGADYECPKCKYTAS